MPSKKLVIAANWKMNGSLWFGKQWLAAVAPKVDKMPLTALVFAPAPYVFPLGMDAQATALTVGAQNVAREAKGAYTGEISASMLKDIGARWCIIGHSERRTLYGETDADIAQKAAQLAAEGILPMLCVGETAEERDAGRTLEVVISQLDAVLSVIGAEKLGAIAYEPVWAIGTGKVPTPEEAQAVHVALRAHVAKYAAAYAPTLPILYGGSVTPQRAAPYLAQPDINGCLLGGAGLKTADFVAVCEAALAAAS